MCVSVYLCVRVYVYLCAFVSVCMCVYMATCGSMCACNYAQRVLYVCMYLYVFAWVCICLCVLSVRVFMYLCVTVCVCVVVGCRRPPVPAHGSTQGVFHHSGARVTFHCDPGFQLSGPRSAVCLLDGTWSASDSQCGNLATPPPPSYPSVPSGDLKDNIYKI